MPRSYSVQKSMFLGMFDISQILLLWHRFDVSIKVKYSVIMVNFSLAAIVNLWEINGLQLVLEHGVYCSFLSLISWTVLHP